MRGGLLFNDQNGVTYSCFNCHYSTSWRPGLPLGHRMRRLFKWMGMDDSAVHRLVVDAIRDLDNDLIQEEKVEKKIEFNEHALPDGALVRDWLDAGMDDPMFLRVVEYMKERGFSLDDYDWYWSHVQEYSHRLIVPYYWNDQIVGFTGRSVRYENNTIKYYQKVDSDFVFGLNLQKPDSKFALVVEGVLDAIAIRGVSPLTNDVSIHRADIIESLGREIIVIPDFDKAGGSMVDAALEYGWNVAFPEWEETIKDCAAAVKRYGRLYTMRSILAAVERSPLKITIARKRHGI